MTATLFFEKVIFMSQLIKSLKNGRSPEQAIEASSLTQSGGTATFTASKPHGLSSNDLVYIKGADQSEYNGRHQVTVTGDTTFTFTVDSSAITPATGTIVAYFALEGVRHYHLVDREHGRPLVAGHVGPLSRLIKLTPTIDTVLYTAGDNVGGKLTLSDAKSEGGLGVKARSLTVIDLDSQDAPLEVVFFDRDPTNATLTNNAAQALGSDAEHVVGQVSVAAGDYVDEGGASVASIKNIDLILDTNQGTDLYAAVKTTGSPTYTGADKLIFKFGLEG